MCKVMMCVPISVRSKTIFGNKMTTNKTLIFTLNNFFMLDTAPKKETLVYTAGYLTVEDIEKFIRQKILSAYKDSETRIAVQVSGTTLADVYKSALNILNATDNLDDYYNPGGSGVAGPNNTIASYGTRLFSGMCEICC